MSSVRVRTQNKVLQKIGATKRSPNIQFDHSHSTFINFEEKFHHCEVALEEFQTAIKLYHNASAALTHAISELYDDSIGLTPKESLEFFKGYRDAVNIMDSIVPQMQIDSYQSTVHQSVHKIRQQCNGLENMVRTFSDNRDTFDHYSRKVAILRDAHEKRMATGKAEKPKDMDKLQRNTVKLEEASEAYTEMSESTVHYLREFCDTRVDVINPLLFQLVQLRINHTRDSAQAMAKLGELSIPAEIKPTLRQSVPPSNLDNKGEHPLKVNRSSFREFTDTKTSPHEEDMSYNGEVRNICDHDSKNKPNCSNEENHNWAPDWGNGSSQNSNPTEISQCQTSFEEGLQLNRMDCNEINESSNCNVPSEGYIYSAERTYEPDSTMVTGYTQSNSLSEMQYHPNDNVLHNLNVNTQFDGNYCKAQPNLLGTENSQPVYNNCSNIQMQESGERGLRSPDPYTEVTFPSGTHSQSPTNYVTPLASPSMSSMQGNIENTMSDGKTYLSEFTQPQEIHYSSNSMMNNQQGTMPNPHQSTSTSPSKVSNGSPIFTIAPPSHHNQSMSYDFQDMNMFESASNTSAQNLDQGNHNTSSPRPIPSLDTTMINQNCSPTNLENKDKFGNFSSSQKSPIENDLFGGFNPFEEVIQPATPPQAARATTLESDLFPTGF